MSDRPKKVHVRAVPWKTSTAEKMKGALGEVPAYIRRAMRVDREAERFDRIADEAREERLLFVFLRLRRILDLAEHVEVPIDSRVAIEALHEEVRDRAGFRKLRTREAPPEKGEPERSLEALRRSVRRFNSRWKTWLCEEAPFDRLNETIEGYNRHFSFERQCALKYVPLDKVKFTKRPPLGVEDVLERLPYLPEP